VNISGTDQAIDKRKTALATKIFFTFDESNLVKFGPLTEKWPWPLSYDLEIQRATRNRRSTCSCKISSSWVQRFM